MAIVNRRIKVMHIISGDLWAGAEVQAYTLLKFLREECDLHVVLMNHGELETRLAALGIPVTVIDESRHNSISILLKLRKLIMSVRPHIIHTHRQKENILGSLANFFCYRAPCVRTSHGASEFAAQGIRQLQVILDRLVGQYLQDAIISVSEDLARKLKVHFPARKIHIIKN